MKKNGVEGWSGLHGAFMHAEMMTMNWGGDERHEEKWI